MRWCAVAGAKPAAAARGAFAADFLFEPLAQLDELDRATDLAEKDFARFRIEKPELTSRRSWNASTRAQACFNPAAGRSTPAADALLQADALKKSMAAAARERKATSKQGGRHESGLVPRPAHLTPPAQVHDGEAGQRHQQSERLFRQ